MKNQMCVSVIIIGLLTGCTFNIKEQSREITLSRSSAGLTEISIEENLIEDNDIDIQGITEKMIIVTVVARMLVLKTSDDDLDNLQLIISSEGTIGFTYPYDDWSRIQIDNMSLYLDKTLDTDLESVSGNITVTDMEGFCRIKTTSGDCRIETNEGCHIRTTSGTIDVTIGYDSLRDTTDAYVKTVSGDVEIFLPADTLAFTQTVCAITVKTTSGNVAISVPRGYTANLDYSTTSGDKTTSPFFNDNSASTNTITCTTSSGDLSIKTYNQ